MKLKDYGSESIEVTDNGIGVEETNFAGLSMYSHLPMFGFKYKTACVV